jgi:hypothetical protein
VQFCADVDTGTMGATTYVTTPGRKHGRGAKWRASSEDTLLILEDKGSQMTVESDKARIAHGFQKGLQGIESEEGRNAIERVCTVYADWDPKTWMWFRSRKDDNEGHAEMASAMMQGALNRHWGYHDPQQTCWTSGTWRVALEAMNCYVNERAETEERHRRVVILSPYVSEACVGNDKATVKRLMGEAIDKGLANAETVVVPCLQKTKEVQAVGHFFIEVVSAKKKTVTVVDSRYHISEDTAQSRTQQYLTQILEIMGEVWGIPVNEWSCVGKGEDNQQGTMTCGPRSMLNALAELVDGKEKQSLLEWHGKIQTVEDFILYQMHVCRRVTKQQDDDGEIWLKGQMVQEGPKTVYGGAAEGKRPGDAIDLEIISSTGQGSFKERAGGGDGTARPIQGALQEGEQDRTARILEGHRHGDGGHVK